MAKKIQVNEEQKKTLQRDALGVLAQYVVKRKSAKISVFINELELLRLGLDDITTKEADRRRKDSAEIVGLLDSADENIGAAIKKLEAVVEIYKGKEKGSSRK